jgi:hypothetical protein
LFFSGWLASLEKAIWKLVTMKPVRLVYSESREFGAQKTQKGLFDRSTTPLQGTPEPLLVFEKTGLINVRSVELVPRDLQDLGKKLRAQLKNPAFLLPLLQLGPIGQGIFGKLLPQKSFADRHEKALLLIGQSLSAAIFGALNSPLETSSQFNRATT